MEKQKIAIYLPHTLKCLCSVNTRTQACRCTGPDPAAPHPQPKCGVGDRLWAVTCVAGGPGPGNPGKGAEEVFGLDLENQMIVESQEEHSRVKAALLAYSCQVRAATRMTVSPNEDSKIVILSCFFCSPLAGIIAS